MRSYPIAALVIVAVACARGGAPSTSPGAPPRSEEALPALEVERLQALGRGDVATLEPMFGDELVVTLGALERTGAQILERVGALAGDGVVIDETGEDVSVTRHGDVAITRGTAVTREPDGRVGRARFTNVWLWRDGRWQLVAGHVGQLVLDR